MVTILPRGSSPETRASKPPSLITLQRPLNKNSSLPFWNLTCMAREQRWRAKRRTYCWGGPSGEVGSGSIGSAPTKGELWTRQGESQRESANFGESVDSARLNHCSSYQRTKIYE